MTTEAEAKTKWCPFARYTSYNGNGINRWVRSDDQNLNPDPAHCIGSDCMAWRKHTELSMDGRGTLVDAGYCGLAGTP